MINRFFTIFFILILFIIVKNVSASLTINEIYPAPATGDYEWVELYNNSSNSADLTQYLLTDLANNKIKINEATLSAQSYLTASCSSVLNNSGDTVFLKKINGEIIETATYSGTFTADKSYAKCSDNNWQTTSTITKNFSNETACLSQILTPSPTSIPVSLPVTPSPTPISYDNIYLSEVYPYPATGENEWVELFNDNDFSVNLQDWYIDDIEDGGSSSKIFSLIIEAKSYAVFDLTSSMFNNSVDSVRFLDFNKNLKDSFEYTGGEKGKSWGRNSFDSDEFCLQEPTKNMANGICISSSSPTSSQPARIATQSVTGGSLTISNLPIRRASQPIIISTSPPEVLGENTNISTSKKNNQKPLAKTLSFIAFSNSLLTIVSILLKIKIHEAIKLFY